MKVKEDEHILSDAILWL